MFALIWDDSAPDNPDSVKLRRSIYDSYEAAVAQGQADIEHGKNVVCIEEIEEIDRHTLNRGTIVWEP